MDENIILVRKGPLSDKIHSRVPGIRVKEEAVETFQDQIELITEIIIDIAAKKASVANRKTIMVNDVESAFEEFMYNKTVINKVIGVLQGSVQELNEIRQVSIDTYFEV